MLKKNSKVIKRFFKFGLVGGVGMVVNNLVLWLMHDLVNTVLFIASPIAIAVAILNNYTLNSFFTWKKNRKNRKFTYLQGLWRYYLTASVSGSLNYLTLLLLTHFTGMYYIYANIIGIFIGMIINFTVSEKWVFSEISKDLNDEMNGTA
jgi:dolichol-phosphate mannosyltransferase